MTLILFWGHIHVFNIVSARISSTISSLVLVGSLTVSVVKLSAVLVTFAGVLFFINSLLYPVVILSADILFILLVISVLITALFLHRFAWLACKQDMHYDISGAVSLSFPLWFQLNANTKTVVTGSINRWSFTGTKVNKLTFFIN